MNQLRINEIGEFYDTEAPGFDGEDYISRLKRGDITWNLFPPVPPSPEANDFSTSTLNGKFQCKDMLTMKQPLHILMSPIQPL